MGKRQTRFAAWRSRLADRLAQSSQVFLLGLVIACGVEVLVDWNQTLFEINVLRDQIRQKGLNYAGLLARAVVEPVLSRDRATFDRLAQGLLDDEDAVFVRIVDPSGKVIYDGVDDSFEQTYGRRGKGTFRHHYGHWLERDLQGILTDPEGFKQRLASSRYRDVPQIYSDLLNRITAYFVAPTPLPKLRARIVYQDRLRDEHRNRDDTVTWALAPLIQESAAGSRQVGAVLVAFDMTRINSAARTKYLKGLGMIVFFVALILLQNISGRRDKLRLLDVGRRYAVAKQALHDAMQQEPVTLSTEAGQLSVHGLIEQAHESVDGMVWDAAERSGVIDLLIADPDGDGIDAAAIGLHILRTFRSRQQAGVPVKLDDDVRALGAATRDIPLTRPIGILRLRILASGEVEALLGSSVSLQIVGGSGEDTLTTCDWSGDIPDGLIGPLVRTQGVLPRGATLVCIATGRGNLPTPVIEEAALRKVLARSLPNSKDGTLGEVLALWLRSKYPLLADSDIVVVTLSRSA